MKLPLITVDSFSSKPFAGNPAAVCLNTKGLDDSVLQNIALEMNLSETAFPVPLEDSTPCNNWSLRWMTPTHEVPLCGHATLAASLVLLNEGLVDASQPLRFQTLSGELVIRFEGSESVIMDFPKPEIKPVELPDEVTKALDINPIEVFTDGLDHYLVIEDYDKIRKLNPDLKTLAKYESRAFCVTAKAPADSEVDFVSRLFGPGVGIDEDPVTGSTHCVLGPYWKRKLYPNEDKRLLAEQQSPRGGRMQLEILDQRVLIIGTGCIVLRGEIEV